MSSADILKPPRRLRIPGRRFRCRVFESILLLTAAGTVRDDADFLFENNPFHPAGVSHLGRLVQDEDVIEGFEVELFRVDAEVTRVVIAASTDGGTFGQVRDLSLRVRDPGTLQELFRFEDIQATTETALVVGEFYRRDGGWRFRAVGQGWTSGLSGLASAYGVIGENAAPAPDPQPDSGSAAGGGGQPVFDHAECVQRSSEARIQAWSRWGTVDDQVLTHIVSPMLLGGPAWPNVRQAFCVVRRDSQVLVGSDGLSDPYHYDGNPPAGAANGLGLELFALTGDRLDRIANSWLWDVVWVLSRSAASRVDMADLLAELRLLSTQLYDVGIPDWAADRFVAADGRVGVILGLADDLPPPTVPGPLSPIRLVHVKLLTRAELDYVLQHGARGREELERRFRAQGDLLTSGLNRPSVV